jgi:hypothetical protein
VTEHQEQVMWIMSASQDFLAEATSQKTLEDGRTAFLFSRDDINKIVKRCVARWNWMPDVVSLRWVATTVPDPAINWCECGSRKPSYWLYDGHGIALCKACDTCKPMRLKRYRPDILSAYEADEPIDDNE